MLLVLVEQANPQVPKQGQAVGLEGPCLLPADDPDLVGFDRRPERASGIHRSKASISQMKKPFRLRFLLPL